MSERDFTLLSGYEIPRSGRAVRTSSISFILADGSIMLDPKDRRTRLPDGSPIEDLTPTFSKTQTKPSANQESKRMAGIDEFKRRLLRGFESSEDLFGAFFDDLEASELFGQKSPSDR